MDTHNSSGSNKHQEDGQSSSHSDEQQGEMRRLQVENKYLKLILDDLHKSIIVGEATLQMELKPPEDIKNDKLLIELTINTRKIHIKFYELETELDYIHRTMSQLTTMIVGNERSTDRIQEKTNKFTATGRQPKRFPANKFEQREQSSKIDKDIELVTSVWRDLKEKEIELSASKQEMANKIKEYEHNYEKLRAEHQNLKTAYTTLQKRCNEDNALPDSEDDVKKKSTDLESKLIELRRKHEKLTQKAKQLKTQLRIEKDKWQLKHEKLTQKVKQLKTQLRKEKDKWQREGCDWKYKYEGLKRTIKESTEHFYKESSPDDSVQFECAGDKGKCYIHEKEILELKERVNTLEEVLRAVQDEADNLSELKTKCERKNTELLNRITILEQNLQKAQNERDALQGQNKSSKRQTKDFPKSFEDSQERVGLLDRRAKSENSETVRTEKKKKTKIRMERDRLKEDKENLRMRLSEIAGLLVVERNPSIADLSDEYRPSKLADSFSELYDNEWTDAFEEQDRTEKEAIQNLFAMLVPSPTTPTVNDRKQDEEYLTAQERFERDQQRINEQYEEEKRKAAEEEKRKKEEVKEEKLCLEEEIRQWEEEEKRRILQKEAELRAQEERSQREQERLKKQEEEIEREKAQLEAEQNRETLSRLQSSNERSVPVPIRPHSIHVQLGAQHSSSSSSSPRSPPPALEPRHMGSSPSRSSWSPISANSKLDTTAREKNRLTREDLLAMNRKATPLQDRPERRGKDPPVPPVKPARAPNNDRSQSDQVMAVSGKQPCSYCGEKLGFGAAMVVESLGLYYHVQCFCCCVCQTPLGNGSEGADVRVRANKLHCQNCYRNDQAGLKLRKV